jgi:hypothetical protein
MEDTTHEIMPVITTTSCCIILPSESVDIPSAGSSIIIAGTIITFCIEKTVVGGDVNCLFGLNVFDICGVGVGRFIIN